jgi:hypothetical protein
MKSEKKAFSGRQFVIFTLALARFQIEHLLLGLLLLDRHLGHRAEHHLAGRAVPHLSAADYHSLQNHQLHERLLHL